MRARQTLGQQIAKEFPTYVQLVNPAPTAVEQARAALRPGEALIATLVTEQKTYVWSVPKDGPLAFATAPIGAKGLDALVTRVRAALNMGARTMGEIPAFDVEAAYELYRLLLEPVKAGWERALTLFIVQDGPLGQLPFALLPTQTVKVPPTRVPLFSEYRDVPWLARRHAVTTLPSLSALVTLRQLPPGPRNRRPFVGFGDPYFSAEQAMKAVREVPPVASVARMATESAGDLTARTLAFRDVLVSPARDVESSQLGMLPRLPDTAEEIRSMARALGADPNRDVFLGVAANEHTVKTMGLTRYRVVAFATHGLVPGDLDGLTQPALALTAPDVAKIDGDGLLTMEEILALRLDADWVVLSACNTANGAGTGAEAISGLGRAFFYAGARALLVTHWPVETRAARALTTDLFQRQAAEPGVSRATALRATMTWMIDEGGVVNPDTGKVVFSFAHPIFWSPFALVGDGG
jgi:CHAT domain-containing protein